MKLFLLIIFIPFIFLAQDFQSNLPIISINTDGNEILDEDRIICDMGIISHHNQLNNLSDPFNNYNGKISIELRGSSSQQFFPKKSYSLETQTLNGSNNNVSLLDLPQENDWVLYGPYSDKTLIRNNLTYFLSTEMGNYAPRSKYCELFVDNEYKGVYLLTEKIKRDKNRVNIKEIEPGDLTGGYIIKIDKLTDAPENASWCSDMNNFNNNPICFQYHYPKADEITIDQKIYIENYINEINHTIENLSENLIDVDQVNDIEFKSFIDYLIISELSKNVDGYRLSTFLYKDSDYNNGRLTMGPVWDYNLSFGNVDFCQSSKINGWVLEEDTPCRGSIPKYWYGLLKNDSFRSELTNRWTELRKSALSFENIFNYIDSVSQYINVAQNRNFELWDILDSYIWPNYQMGFTYQDEVNFLKHWIYSRVNWIDNNIGDFRLIFPDCSSSEKQLIAIINQLGQRVTPIKNEILFYIYDNGCVEQHFISD